jgi:putative membrane protein
MIRLPIASLIGACATGLLVVASSAHAQGAPAAQDDIRLHAEDQAFIDGATRSVSTQHDAARLATSRSTDREVKAFAEHVGADNVQLSAALRAASPHGVDVPDNNPDTAVLDSIKDLRGGDFDKAYIEQVALADEQKTVSIFQAEIASGRNGQLKEAARKGLPTVQADYAQARELARRKHLAE